MAKDQSSLTTRLRHKAGTLVAAVVDRRVRSQWVTRMLAGDAVHQDATVTKEDRYPELFSAVAAQLGGEPCTILSYGCSSGEEVVALRRYFPAARIVGAEINKAMLARCRRLPVDPDTTFVHSTPDGIAALGPYDAIFCMAVLQRRPHMVDRDGLTDISKHYPFSRFAEAIAFLTNLLKPAGLLIVEHSQYRVEDVASALSLVPAGGTFEAKGPRFDATSQRIEPQPIVSRIFRLSAS